MESSQFEAIQTKLSPLLQAGHFLHFNKGQVLFYEGHYPYGVYLIRSGKIRFINSRRSKKREELLWEASEGNLIGIDHVVDRTPFLCTCIAETNCEVIFISKTALMNALNL